MQGDERAAKDRQEIVRQLRAGGAPEAEIAKLTGQEGDGGDYEIWPENADALRAFSFCESQWRVIIGANGGVVWQGLRYDSVDRAIRALGITDEADLWWAIRVMEREATTLLNERANDK